jgi:hypothetical protein
MGNRGLSGQRDKLLEEEEEKGSTDVCGAQRVRLREGASDRALRGQRYSERGTLHEMKVPGPEDPRPTGGRVGETGQLVMEGKTEGQKW